MLGIFGKNAKRLQKKVDKMEIHLRGAFSKVKTENAEINAWLKYYYGQSNYYQNELKKFILSIQRQARA